MLCAFNSASFTSLSVIGWDVSKVKQADSAFADVTLTEIDFSGWKLSSSSTKANFVMATVTILCDSDEEKALWESFKGFENISVVVKP
ncbi:MAG: hypothetical protein ACRC45_02155, partial [Cetobacterium sp.]